MPFDVREIVAGETLAAFDALSHLRSTLPSERSDFICLIDGELRPQGYRLAGVFDDGRAAASAVVGFRQFTMLAYRNLMYVDDLSTLPGSRGRGMGRLLLDWVAVEAQRLGCDQIHLDSGLGPSRGDAHRLYFRTGLEISAFHFSRVLNLDPAANGPRQ